MVDVPISQWDATFIPERLTEALMQTSVRGEDGEPAAMLGPACLLTPGTHDWAQPEPPNWNGVMGAVGLALAGLIGLTGRSSRKGLRRLCGGVLGGLGVLGGFLGTANLVLWLTSTLPVYGPNENWWVSNPLTLLLLVAGWAVIKQRWSGWLRGGLLVLLALASLGVLLELSPWNVQDNAAFFAVFWPVIAATVWLSRRG